MPICVLPAVLTAAPLETPPAVPPVEKWAELAAFRKLQLERPYRVNHIGLRIPTVAALDETLGRLETLKAGELAGRLDLLDRL